MRSVGLSDLDVAVRALLVRPRLDWDRTAARLIEDAHLADVWRKRHGVAHPGGGTGSLYAQACLMPRVPSSRCSEPYCEALTVILDALAAWRGRGNQDL